MHTRVRSYSWGRGPYSYSTAVLTAACIRPIEGHMGMVVCVCKIMISKVSQKERPA